jgi:hypothetical protein
MRSSARPDTTSSQPLLPEFSDLSTLCLFIGHPRSGHTLVGALLDAHPNAVIAQKLDVLGLVLEGLSGPDLIRHILENSAQAAREGRAASGYTYAVTGQWQGTYRTLRVVGDKSGGYTTLRLTDTPELLDRLREMLPLQVALLHVVRNPFNNIATLFRRGSFPSLERAIAFYDELCQTVAMLEARCEPGTLYRMHHEQLLQTPREHLAALCTHLGLSAPDEWLDASSRAVWSNPSEPRRAIAWTSVQIDAIEALIGRYSFLLGYRL